MALSINTNIASLQAQMNLNKASEAMKQNQERLSTGLRINSASDDAAGLAITDRMTSQIRGLDQAAANANDGISLAQTAEGAMDETTNLLQRMRELAVQSANDSNTDTDRQSIQDEVNQLISEVNRIAENTTYNQQNVLDGNLKNSVFHVGADPNQDISFGIDSAKAADLGQVNKATGEKGNFELAYTQNSVTSVIGDVAAGNSLDGLGDGDLAINGTDIRATQTGDDTSSNTDNAGSAIAIASAINASSDTTNVMAKAEQTEATFVASSGGSNDITGSEGDLKINGITIGDTSVSGEGTDTAAAGNLAESINAKYDETGVNATTDGATVVLTAEDGRNIEVDAVTEEASDAMANVTGTGTRTVRGNVSLYSNQSFEVGGYNPSNAGFSAETVNLEEAKLQDVAGTASETFNLSHKDRTNLIEQGNLVINGQTVNLESDDTHLATEKQSNVDAEDSAATIAESINNSIDDVTAEAYTKMNLGKVQSTDNGGTLSINGAKGSNTTVNIGAVKENDSDGSLVAAINSSQEAVSASVNDDGELILESDKGANIDVQVTSQANDDYLANIDATDTSEQVISKGTISFADGQEPDSVEGIGKILAGISEEGVTVGDLDVTTQDGANEAISVIDEAIKQIDNEKAKLGAIQNRFDSTISNLNNVKMNITDARSRIQDADIAKESSEQTMNQVRRQAASSVLAQANQGPQLAMQLLGG